MITPRARLLRLVAGGWLPAFLLIYDAAANAAQPAPSPAAETPKIETAESILRKAAAIYASVSSYSDSGVVLTHDTSKPSPGELTFVTYFRRPDLFRFEWTSHHPYPPLRHIKTYSIIWSNGKQTYLYRDRPDTFREEKDLTMAVAAATGVSKASAHHIPRLLTSKVTGFALTDLRVMALTGQNAFEGVACYCITGEHPRGGQYEIWLGKDDYLIRRILVRRDTFPMSEEIHRDITINGEISPGVFEVKVPAPAK